MQIPSVSWGRLSASINTTLGCGIGVTEKDILFMLETWINRMLRESANWIIPALSVCEAVFFDGSILKLIGLLKEEVNSSPTM